VLDEQRVPPTAPEDRGHVCGAGFSNNPHEGTGLSCVEGAELEPPVGVVTSQLLHPGRCEAFRSGREHHRDAGRSGVACEVAQKVLGGWIGPVHAQRWLAAVEVSKSRGQWLDPKLGRVTVGEWSQTFAEGLAHLKASTRERYLLGIRAHIVPTFGSVPLSRVAYTDIARWVQALTDQGLAPATVRYAHRVLALLLDSAVRDGRLPGNPALGVRLPRVLQADKRFLTVEQVNGLALHAEPYGTLIRLLAYTGLRWGEAAALRVRRVDLTRRRIEVAEATAEVSGRVVVGTPKNHQRRTVPVPRFLVDELRRAVEGKGPDDLVFAAPQDGYPEEHQLPAPRLRPSGRGCWPPRPDAARTAPHRSQSGCRRGRERQGGTADARSRVSRNDPRCVRGPVRGRPRRPGGRTRPAPPLRNCGLDADQAPRAQDDDLRWREQEGW
jgi:integrase